MAYEALKAQFTEEEQVKLTLMINVINGWNRLAVGFGVWVEPQEAKAARALLDGRVRNKKALPPLSHRLEADDEFPKGSESSQPDRRFIYPDRGVPSRVRVTVI
jgi:hypothetical protein